MNKADERTALLAALRVVGGVMVTCAFLAAVLFFLGYLPWTSWIFPTLVVSAGAGTGTFFRSARASRSSSLG